MLTKLASPGVSDQLLSCLQSFLTGGYFHVEFGNHFSGKHFGEFPQNGALSSSLFFLYPSDLPMSMKIDLRIKLYVDDIEISAPHGPRNSYEIDNALRNTNALECSKP